MPAFVPVAAVTGSGNYLAVFIKKPQLHICMYTTYTAYIIYSIWIDTFASRYIETVRLSLVMNQ